MDMTGHGTGDELLQPATGLPKEKILYDRLILLKEDFVSKFCVEPDIYLRIPGRVNLIGEHIDYCGYSVCPMALHQDILVAFRTTNDDNFLTVINSEPEKYIEYSTKTNCLKFSLKNSGWVSYFLCGVKAILELLRNTEVVTSMQVAISGNIPPGSGLSSSSALVCAGVLTTAISNQMQLSKSQMATVSGEAEHYIGTFGGGMDQAIICLASEGCAKLIDFNPLRTRNVKLPQGAVFVVAHSLVTKNKAASNDYNSRVVECRLSTQILAKSRNLPWERCQTLAEFQDSAGLTFTETTQLIHDVLHEAPYTKSEVCLCLGVSSEQLDELTLTPDTRTIQEFKLFQRALHVIQEAERVSLFEAKCRQSCDLSSLGQLMTESHNSLRDLYECSHPQVDRLVSIALSAGALGARLTGAGWGGCIVALIPENIVNNFITTVKSQFYADNPEAVGKNIDNLIFVTKPGQGVQIFKP